MRNELWTGDVAHRPVVAGRKTYLFAFVDDHSWVLVGYRFGHAEDVLRLEAAFRTELSSRGVPSALFHTRNNGSPYVSRWLLRACGRSASSWFTPSQESRPRAPRSKGCSATVRSQFLVELQRRGVAHLAELNALFATWVETVYHRRRRSVAENVALSLTTGAQVLVTGRLQSRNWETEDGQKRSAVEIEAEEVAASLVAEGAGQTYTRPGVTRKAS